MRLSGKVALVTGAAQGIGAAIAARFRAEGAEVMATDLKEANAIRLLDVTRVDDWAEIHAHLAERHGRLDVLVHNAGISGFAPLAQLTPERWQAFFEVNVTGAFLGTRALMPLLEKAPSASIIAIGSTLALRPAGPLPAYAASKGALRSFVKAIALDCAHRGTRIRANAIHPGSTETPMMAANLEGDAEGRARRLAAHPLSKGLGRLVMPEDVAAAALFLASDESIFITGIDLPVDGGATI
jgi:NAD(P)-dependent dehydrogenase (short-subunit alcohol dehydrogenase family)